MMKKTETCPCGASVSVETNLGLMPRSPFDDFWRKHQQHIANRTLVSRKPGDGE